MAGFFKKMTPAYQRKQKKDAEREEAKKRAERLKQEVESLSRALKSALELLVRQNLEQYLPSGTGDTLPPILAETILEYEKENIDKLPEGILGRYQKLYETHEFLKRQGAYKANLDEIQRFAPYAESLSKLEKYDVNQIYLDIFNQFLKDIPNLIQKPIIDSYFMPTLRRHGFDSMRKNDLSSFLTALKNDEKIWKKPEYEDNEVQPYSFHFLDPLAEFSKQFSEVQAHGLELDVSGWATKLFSYDEPLGVLKAYYLDLLKNRFPSRLITVMANHCGASRTLFEGALRDLEEAENVVETALSSHQKAVAIRQEAEDERRRIKQANLLAYETQEQNAIAALQSTFQTTEMLAESVESGRLTPVDMQAHLRYQISEENALRSYLYAISDHFLLAQEMVDPEVMDLELTLLQFEGLTRRRNDLYQRTVELNKSLSTLPAGFYLQSLQQCEFAYTKYAYEKLKKWFTHQDKHTTLSFYSELHAQDLLEHVPAFREREATLKAEREAAAGPKRSFLDRVTEEMGG